MVFLLTQFKRRDLVVARTLRRELALIQKKLANRHSTKMRSRQSIQLFLQPLELLVGHIISARVWCARTSSTRQREVRTESMILFRNSECETGVVDRLGESRELRPGFNSDPEDARSLCGGKKAIASKCHLDRRSPNVLQNILDFFDSLK